MTVIAYRAGVMAADTLVWNTSNVITGRCQKITRLKDGGLLAASGYSSEIQQATAWIDGGRDPATKPVFTDPQRFNCIWVQPSGCVKRLGHDLIDQQLTADFYAISCAHDFTLGCLYAGASAEQAVRLTLQHTDAGGGGSVEVQVERLGGVPMMPRPEPGGIVFVPEGVVMR
jgi:hypothetical protein